MPMTAQTPAGPAKDPIAARATAATANPTQGQFAFATLYAAAAEPTMMIGAAAG